MEKVMVIVEGKLMIDYAYPMLMAENALKKAHQHMLKREYDEAIEELLKATAECKLSMNAIKHMKEEGK